MDELLSIPEVARACGVSETVVKRWIKRGELTTDHEETHGKQHRRFFKASQVSAHKRKREESVIRRPAVVQQRAA